MLYLLVSSTLLSKQKAWFLFSKQLLNGFKNVWLFKKWSFHEGIKENYLLYFSIKMSSTILTFTYFTSSMILGYYLITLSKKLEIETTFKLEYEKIQYAKFEWFCFCIEEYFYLSWQCQNISSLVLWAKKNVSVWREN